MSSKNQTPSSADDQMLNPKTEKSYSTSPLHNGELMLPVQSVQPFGVSLHQRLAGDSIPSVKRPCLVGPSSNINMGIEGCSKLITEPQHPTHPGKWTRNIAPVMDPKKMKRLIANRVSAQKSRQRQAEYIEKLKRDLSIIEAKVAYLGSAVALAAKNHMWFRNANNEMRQRLEFLKKKKELLDAETKALTEERDMLYFTLFLMEEGL